jgi:hypothetical protein
MSKFRKKPVVIEAWQFNGTNFPAVYPFIWVGRELKVETLAGDMTVSPGDWVITGVKGEVYPCKPDIFEATYEPVE